MSHQGPTLAILGGINGAGKTTTAERLATLPPYANAVFLNPDKITAAIRLAEPELPLSTAEFRGIRRVAEEIDRLIASRRSFVTETVLASAVYRKLCREAQEVGFRVHLFWVGLGHVEESIARVALRVAKGGHDVPEAAIRRRWPATHENLAWFAQHADEVDVFDNSGYGQPPRLIATARAGAVTLLDRHALPEVTRVLVPLAGH